MKFATKSCSIVYHTIRISLHYLGKLEAQIYRVLLKTRFIMAAHSNGAVVTFFFLFSLAYSQRSEIGCLPFSTHNVAVVRIYMQV